MAPPAPALLTLVNYSSSDEEDEIAPPPPAKLRKCSTLSSSSSGKAVSAAAAVTTSLPPLPSRFLDLYVVAPRAGKDDDPTLHGGRRRATPHVAGNWPTHVFVEWHLSRREWDALDTIYNSAKAVGEANENGKWKLESHLKSELGSELPLHLSLSRPNVLRTEQREGFLETLRERCGKARVRPFAVEFTGFEWVGNYDRTRWFLTLKAAVARNSELPRLLDLANRTFAAFKQPGLYSKHADPTMGFHVSLAWSLTKPSAEVEQRINKALQFEGDRILLENDEGVKSPVRMQVKNIKVKIGSNFHAVEFMPIGGANGEESGENRKRRRLSQT